MQPNKTFNIACSIFGVVLWFTFFGLGLFINSKPFRDSLGTFNLEGFFMSMLTFTPTNIAFLCIAAAFCGGCSNNLNLAKINPPPSDATKTTDLSQGPILQQNPFNCMIRGFVVYIAFIGGMYVIADSPFTNTTPDQYARAAGLLSMLAYLVGYDQSNFVNLINISSKLKKEGS